MEHRVDDVGGKEGSVAAEVAQSPNRGRAVAHDGKFDWSNDEGGGKAQRTGPQTKMNLKGEGRMRGLRSALIGGLVGAMSSIVTKVAFDLTSRESFEQGTEVHSGGSLVHILSDTLLTMFGSLIPIVTQIRILVGLTQIELPSVPGIDKFFPMACESHVTTATCATDWFVRVGAFVTYLIAGGIALSYYVAALSLLPSAVEATAASFASSFLVSGICGALLFREWDGRSFLGGTLWIIGAALIVFGVWVIGTETPKVEPLERKEKDKDL